MLQLPWRQVPSLSRAHFVLHLPRRVRCRRRQDLVLALSVWHVRHCWLVLVQAVPERHYRQRAAHRVRLRRGSDVQLPLPSLLQLPRWQVPEQQLAHQRRLPELPRWHDILLRCQRVRLWQGQALHRQRVRELPRWPVPELQRAPFSLLQVLHGRHRRTRRCLAVLVPTGVLLLQRSRLLLAVRRQQVHTLQLPPRDELPLVSVRHVVRHARHCVLVRQGQVRVWKLLRHVPDQHLPEQQPAPLQLVQGLHRQQARAHRLLQVLLLRWRLRGWQLVQLMHPRPLQPGHVPPGRLVQHMPARPLRILQQRHHVRQVPGRSLRLPERRVDLQDLPSGPLPARHRRCRVLRLPRRPLLRRRHHHLQQVRRR